MLLLLAGRSSTARAQTPEPANRAGLVVQHGDGSLTTRCVAFAEDEITGEELLRRSGLPLTVDPTMGFGTAVCKLDGEGCNYPKENCWCQCQGSPCLYWTYAHLKADGTWQLAGIGATARRLRNGDVDGWAWGPGTPGSGVTPPPITFDEVCPSEAVKEEQTVRPETALEAIAGEAMASPEPAQESSGGKQTPESVEGDLLTPADLTGEAPVAQPGQSAMQSGKDQRPTPRIPEQLTARPTHTLPSHTPSPAQLAESVELSAKPQAAASGSAGETMAAGPGRSYRNYAVFAAIVLALVGWLGLTRARR